jgi:anti-anti-sigma factor
VLDAMRVGSPPALPGTPPATHEVTLELTGTLDRRSAESTRPVLFAAIADTTSGTDVIVDLARVTHVDACGLGLLLAAHRRAAAGGSRLVLRSPGPGLVHAVAVTKLSRVLHLSR